MSKKGVNLWKNINELDSEEAITTQNLIYNNGMVKRGGQSLWASSQVVASTAITGLHRFYYGSGSVQTLAACGTTVKYWDGAAWQNVKTGLTTGLQTYFTTWLNNAYISNGTDAPHKWNGAADSAVSAAPATTIQFLPYQDRLLSIDTTGNLTWSGSYDDTTWVSAANAGVRPDTQLFGMCYNSNTNNSSGYQSKVLLAGANGMYIFWGTDLRYPSTIGNYTIYPLGTSVGCNAPRTMCWTPKGTIYLGIDRQVYLLPFDSPQPVPIGQKVTSNTHLSGIQGIEEMPTSYIKNACAAYHNNFYILSVMASGGIYNTIQWWLDLSRLYQDENGHWGPWYGPMVGQSISCFALMNGNGDSGQLLGGEANATTGGNVYQLNQSDVYSDNGTAINLIWQTFYNPLGNVSLRKDVHRVETELLNVAGTTTMNFLDIDAFLQTGVTLNLSGGTYWNDGYWNDNYWSGQVPTRQIIDCSPAIQPRRMSIYLTSSSSNDKFQLYGLRVEAIEQNQVFA
ncbi:MAG: hypothetical protein KGJ89_05065 [Patescibacteria group bacterium]|nr:hypothetical protein [Patescibacteria group bacterium]MDE2227292.1 hypothetical protein [Patescibacteria group bacterium]